MRRKNNESGVILPMVIIFALALTITGLAFLNMAVMEHNLAMREVHKTQAFYLAEAGIEKARFKLGEDWNLVKNYDEYGKQNTSLPEAILGEGVYNVTIYNTESDDDTGLSSDRRRVNSTGIVKNVSQIVQVIVKQAPSGAEINAALEAGGNVIVRGDATVRGDSEHKAIIAEAIDLKGSYMIEPPEPDGISESPVCTADDPYLSCFLDPLPGYPYEDFFEYVFKMKKGKVKELAQSGKNKYYPTFVRNPENVAYITWIEDSDGAGSRITYNDWYGEGILIVNGDLTITGGTFNGILWVTGTLEIGAGRPVINGAVVVESGATVPLEGKLTVNYDREQINLALGKIATLPWIEPGTWEQLK